MDGFDGKLSAGGFESAIIDTGRRLRIVYLINGLNGGGAAFPIIDVVGLMRAAGHEVRLLALMKQDGLAQPRLRDAGFECEVLGGSADYFESYSKLVTQLRRFRPDVLWTSLTRATIFGQLAGRQLGIPVVSWQHNAFLKLGNRAILRRTRGLTRQWVADSQSVSVFAQRTLRIPAQKLTVWPLFIARPEAPQAAAWNGAGKFRIGSLGRLHRNKQYEVLIRVAARIRDLDPELSRRLEFVVAGSGPEERALRRLAQNLNVTNLRLCGFLETPREFLAGLHAYFQPSRNEGLCLAAHEAMLASLPVVATPVGELQHSVLDGVTGRLCAKGDIEAMARALMNLARHPGRAAEMGRMGRGRVLSLFGETRFRQTGLGLLESLVSAAA